VQKTKRSLCNSLLLLGSDPYVLAVLAATMVLVMAEEEIEFGAVDDGDDVDELAFVVI
jgi:hypothetical protein